MISKRFFVGAILFLVFCGLIIYQNSGLNLDPPSYPPTIPANRVRSKGGQGEVATHDALVQTLQEMREDCIEHHMYPLPEAVIQRYVAAAEAHKAAGHPVPAVRMTAPRFCHVQVHCYSRDGEDGILLYLLALSGGPRTSLALELAGGTGSENNVVNLAVNLGFKTFMANPDPKEVRLANEFFDRTRFKHRPVFLGVAFTTEIAGARLRAAGFSGPLDVLSIDDDNSGYWMLKHLVLSLIVDPRIVIVEFQEQWGPRLARVRPYRPGPVGKAGPHELGASLNAFAQLLESRNYRLVGCTTRGNSAFFVKNGVADRALPAYPKEGCFAHWDTATIMQMRKRFKDGLGVAWLKVERFGPKKQVVEMAATGDDTLDPQEHVFGPEVLKTSLGPCSRE